MNHVIKLKKLRNSILAVLVFSCNTVFAITTSNPLYNILQQDSNGSWAQLNQNTFDSVTTPAQYQLTGVAGNYGKTVNHILTAWSGFAWDSNLDELIIYGGGHNNYAGNDVYTWNSSNLNWQRASLPTQLTPVNYTDNQGNPYTYYYTVDNGATPQSAHTYGNNVFLPTLDRFLTFGGYVFSNTSATPYIVQNGNGGFQYTGPYLFDPNKADPTKVGGATGTGVDPTTQGGNMWQNRDIFTNLNSSPVTHSFGSGMASVVTENGKDVVYVVGDNPTNYGKDLFKYIINDINDPSKDSWSIVGTPDPYTFASQGAGAVDTDLNIFVRTGSLSIVSSTGYKDFIFWDLNKAGTNNSAQYFNAVDHTGGLFQFANLGAYGMDYDPLDKQFYLWGGGNTVFTLSHGQSLGLTDGWVLGIDSVLGSTAPGGNAANSFSIDGGVLGKWHWASDLKAFIGLQTDGNVWVYKPSDFSLTQVPLPGPFWLFTSIIATFGLIQRKYNKIATL